MSIRRLGGVFAVALMAAALVPATSSAISVTNATPISIADGNNAAVTVDATGAAHIAFDGNEPGTNSLHYCKLLRGATACTVQTDVTAASTTTSLEHPIVVPNGNTIRIVSYRYGFSTGTFGQDIVYTSTDGGQTWDNGVSAGANPFSLAIPGPGNAVSTITNVDSADGGTIYQRVPIDGSSAGNTRANLSSSHLGEGALGLIDANTPIASMTDLSDNAFWRRYTGNGDPNDAANWTPEQPVGVVRTARFAYGESGVFLIGGDNGVLKSRRYNGNGFDAPVSIPAGDSGGEVPQSYSSQDPGGRIHVVMPQITAQCCKVLYATSDDGVNWAARQFQLGTDLPGQMQVSAASDHLGFAVWHIGNGSTRHVFALPIGPSAAVPELGKSAAAALVSGTVLVKQPGSKSFVKLTGQSVVPVGSIVDAKKGRVRITTALPGGKLQSADFYSGVFKVTQARNGLATMVLTGGSFRSCGRGSRAGRAAKSKTIQQLWGNGKGKFRTKGKYASATIRGTVWLQKDTCSGTLTVVKQGSVIVRDFKKRKNIVVKAHHSYLAKA